MSSEVRHSVDRGQAYPLIRLTGVLDATSAATVRDVLVDVLAEQPEAMVVEVGGLDGQQAGADVLREVFRENTAWPAARLALCDTRADARWEAAGWPVWPDEKAAFAALGAPEPGRRISLTLAPVVGAARRSRELITEACGRWGRPELVGSACIVVTELVNNVVAHARTEMTVLIAAQGRGMSVAVRDRSRTVPTFSGQPVAPTSYGGRGMLLIDSVASRWGSLALADGKVVWARLNAETDSPDPLRASMADPARG